MYHDLIDRSHFHDVLELFVHVAQSELTVFELFDKLLVVLELKLLHLLDKTFNVTHSEHFADEWLRLKRLEVVRVLTGTNENDRTLRSGDTSFYLSQES